MGWSQNVLDVILHAEYGQRGTQAAAAGLSIMVCQDQMPLATSILPYL